MSRSSTSSSEAAEPRDPSVAEGRGAGHGAPLPALGDAPAGDGGGHQVRPITHRRTRSVVLWALGCTVVLLLAAEVGTRALGDLPANRTWPDAESQFKAEHAAAVSARGERERVVLGGSSVSDAAFDPATIMDAAGWDGGSFNYAQEGSLSSTTTRFLEAAVIDQVDPEVVVIGVFPGDIGASPSHAASLGDELARSRGYRLASGTPTVADRIDDAATSRSALVAHREVLRDPRRLLQWLRSPTTPGFLDARTGSLLRHRDVEYVRGQAAPAAGADGSTDALVPIEPEVDALKRFADALAERGRRLVVVELPILEDAPGDIDAEARRITHEAMVGLEEAGCAERIDLRSMLQEDRYWSDPSHVNAAGTEALSQAVGDWLREHPEAPTDC